MGWTSPRILKKVTVAAAHQTAFGSAASSGGALVRAQCLGAEPLRHAVDIDPQGTHGSEFERDTRTEVATRPGARLRFYAGSRAFLAFMLEHATHGQPRSTLAAGDISETGDTGNDLATWVLNGVRPGFNTSSDFKLYVKLEDETPGAGQARVSIYSDSARTALVAQGSAANNNSVTLAAQNSSGLSGTVALAAPAASNLTGIVLTLLKVRPQRSTTIDRYFTLFVDTGAELVTISDCTVKALRFRSEQGGPLVVDVDILGSTYAALGATALTPALAAADKEYFAHARAAFSWNAVAQSVLSLGHGIEHDVEQDLANAATPASIWKRGSRLAPIEAVERFAAESRTILDDGLAGTWRQVVITYTYGTKVLSFTYPRCRVRDSGIPAIGERGFEDHRLAIDARDDGTNDPIQVVLDL